MVTQERNPNEIYEHNYVIHKSHEIVLLHLILVVASGSENSTPVLADGQEPRNGDSSDEVLLSLVHPMTADVLVYPNKEHSDEVHPPPTHSVAADVQELPSDDYANEVYLSYLPPTATNVQEPSHICTL